VLRRISLLGKMWHYENTFIIIKLGIVFIDFSLGVPQPGCST